MNTRGLVALAWVIAPWGVARAQCADGSPPPCRARTAPVAATRRADPPMDAKTWIVVPFDNLNNSQEIDWLRGGSVNLLYLGMSRWTDLRVIDDERVADYMREVPGTADAKQLSLNQAIAVAKRAGAGRLVMGDLLKLGARTTVNAKIFDVKTGQRLRTVREETSVADSLMPMFGKLSQKILNIAPPAGSSSGVVGTTSIGAYQAYAEGMQALNKFELELAQRRFYSALQLDSTFALPHAKLAVLLGWLSPGAPTGQQHADAAGRLAAGLPPREKALIDAQVAFSHQDYVKSCAGFRSLLKKDSTDTDAWYGLGDCLYHDPAMEPVPGDSTRLRFRGDRNASMRAFRTTLALDPTYHLAYQHLVDANLAQSINARGCVGQRCAQYFAMLRPSGDSLIVEPVALPRDSSAYRLQIEDMVRINGRRVGLERALATTDRWLEANPSEVRARMMRGATLLTLGRVAGADSMMRDAVYDTTNGGMNAYMARLELGLKQWRAAQTLFLYDSLRTKPFVVRGGANPITIGNVLAQMSPIFGQLSVFDSLVAIGNRGAPASRSIMSRSLLRNLSGVPTDSLATAFNLIFSEFAAKDSSKFATRVFAPFLVFTWREWPASQWPKLDSTVTDARALGAIAMQRGDTALLRRATLSTDSLSRALASALLPDSGLGLVAAEGYLALRDSAAALNTVRNWLDNILPFTPVMVGQVQGNAYVMIPRMVLLRADLAAAAGNKAEARLWYQRFLDLWAKSDPQAAPVLDRVRKALAGLSA